MQPTPQKVIDRLLEKIEIDVNGCWISLYSTGSHGYSQIGWNQGGKVVMRLGHRVSWEALWGPVPDGLTIDHECRVRRCINPEHLRLKSNVENATDNGWKTREGFRTAAEPIPGRMCGKGLHQLLRYPSGAVACRECSTERSIRKQKRSGRYYR